MDKKLNKYSEKITQDDSPSASSGNALRNRHERKRYQKGQIGIVSTGFQGNPCNMHLNGLADDSS